MSYYPVEIVSREMSFRPEDLIEHRLTLDGRKVKFEHMSALDDLLEDLKKYVYLEQSEYLNHNEYAQRLHLWIVPPEQIQVKVYDKIPKDRLFSANMLNQSINVKSQFLKGGI